MGSEEIEVGYGGGVVKAKGLLAIKSAFVGAMSLLYLYFVLSQLRLEVVTATGVYLLCVIIFVSVFFGSARHTFRLPRKSSHKTRVKKAKGPLLDKYMK